MSQEYVNGSKKRQKRPGVREGFFTGAGMGFKAENQIEGRPRHAVIIPP